METTTCSKCPAKIFFATTKNGKDMPIDAEPSANGNLRITESSERPGTFLATVIPFLLRATEPTLHKSHFVTCPEAAAFRRGKK